MGKGIQKWSNERIDQRQREGYGCGEGAAYKPWVGMHDVASAGRMHRAFSQIFGRTIYLLSDVEWNTFLLLEYSRKFTQVYEGFPLPRETTLQIAEALGIRHPQYPATHVPTVMTVDFLAVEQRGDDMLIVAFDCKRSEDAEDERALEKLQITREYFAGVGVAHHLIFHSALPMSKVKNIEWMRAAILKEGEIELYEGYIREKATQMWHELSTGKHTVPLNKYCASFELRHQMGRGDGLRVARILLWELKLKCDISNANLQFAPLNSFVSTLDEREPRAVGQ
jgi:hypothetical protein